MPKRKSLRGDCAAGLSRLTLALFLLLTGNGLAAAQGENIDHYVLALSWSPTFCASPEAEDASLQCGRNRRFAFVVHGLWPQGNSARPPQFCESHENWVPQAQIDEMLPIMPSKALIIHEWKKHGTCSGLGMSGYFDFTETLFGNVKIPARYLTPLEPVTTTPDVLISDFVKTNRGLSPEMMTVVCKPRSGRARLRELRICFSPDGQFTQCRHGRQSDCAARELVLPPVRASSIEP
jgi:ribonuclease T2